MEYTKCIEKKCDLDHTDGATYEQSLLVQEPFRVSTIIDTILEEAEHTAYAIHEINNKAFAERLKNEELYVSPSIWILGGRAEVVGTTPEGEPIIDGYDWKAIHSAWVTDPAFGKDAKITMTCEDNKANCMMRLKPEFGTPIMVKHGKSHTYVSVDKAEYDKLNSMQNFTDQDVNVKKCNCELEKLNDDIAILNMNIRTSEMQIDMQL